MTHDEIVEQARAARASLVGIVDGIDEEIATVKDKEWIKPLTKADRDKLKELRAAKNEVMLAIEELAYVTMGALDKTDGVRRIKNALTGIRRDLSAERQRLERFSKIPGEFAGVLAKMKKIADKINEELSG